MACVLLPTPTSGTRTAGPGEARTVTRSQAAGRRVDYEYHEECQRPRSSHRLPALWARARTRSAAPLVIGSRLGQHPIANYVPLKLLPSVLHGQKNCHVLRPKYSLYVVHRGLRIPQRNLLPQSLGHRLVFARSKAVARDAPTLCQRWWKDRRELPADADSHGDTPPVALTS